MELVCSFPAWGEVPSPLFTSLAFDQLLLSPQPAEGQTGAELPNGGRSGVLLALSGAGPAETRPLGKHSFSHLTSSPGGPGCRQSSRRDNVISVRELKLRDWSDLPEI